jgi:hypothetical protein
MLKTIVAWWKHIACLLIIVALAVLFMGESLLPNKMLAPLDSVMQLRPWSASEQAISGVYNGLPSDKVLFIASTQSDGRSGLA